MATLSRCPVCGGPQLVDHCDKSTTCRWLRCRGCHARLDHFRGRGFFNDGKAFRRVTFARST